MLEIGEQQVPPTPVFLQKSAESLETKRLVILHCAKSAQEYQNKWVINCFVSIHCKRVRKRLKQKSLERDLFGHRAKECGSD
jgi:hypothetical protein